MQKITTCLGFNDRAEEAVRFYTTVFKNSKILNIAKWGDTGPGRKGDVMAVDFEIEGERFLALNGGPPFTFTIGMSLMVHCKTQDEIDYYWQKLSEGGRTDVCGWLTDKFGVSWQIVPTIIEKVMDDKDAKRRDRAMEVVLKSTKLVIADIERAYEGR